MIRRLRRRWAMRFGSHPAVVARRAERAAWREEVRHARDWAE